MDIFEEILAAKKAGNPVVLATVIESLGSAPREGGAKMLIRPDGSTAGTVGGGAIEKRVIDCALQLIQGGRPCIIKHDLKDIGMACGGGMSVFLEPLFPAPRLIVFGAGHIGSVLSHMAKLLEFNVTVVDSRPDFANADKLPWADSIVAEPYPEAIEKLVFNSNTFVVIMTPKHANDFEVLERCIGKPFRYLGMIGSRKKIGTAFERLRKKGIADDLIEKVYAPVGLNIPASTPAEIAVAIAGQLVEVRNQETGASSSCPA